MIETYEEADGVIMLKQSFESISTDASVRLKLRHPD